MQRNADIAIVPIEADLDVSTVPAARRMVDGLIDGGCRRVILNMAGVSYVDSAGMGLIISEIAHMRRLGGLLSLVNVSAPVLRGLKLARVVDFAPVSTRDGSRDVPTLDPSVRPLWRRVLRVDPGALSSLRSRTDALLSQLPLSADERFDANLAIGEAVGNAVDHTDGKGVAVSVAGYPDRVVVEVSDCGCGVEAGRMDAEHGAWDARGRGIALMRMLADSVTIEPKQVGSGTVVRIVKLIGATSTL